ncbi:ThuA domain-containing protein [Streptomyces sp. RK23]|nr:ThuA domain-containing protein [Streptomyces sp. RK74B]MBQ1003245.1 ThuA domain-containing protein [Streptomyces sp. RK23]
MLAGLSPARSGGRSPRGAGRAGHRHRGRRGGRARRDHRVAAPSLGRSATDLVVHSWSGGELPPRQEGNLVAAVKAGTGFAGWRGGVIGTNVRSAEYLRMVGSRSLWRGDGLQEFTVRIVAMPDRDGVITKGIEDYGVVTEHYWVLTGAHNSALAASVLVPETADAWDVPVEFPVVWTRRWGVGRVFVCTLGHRVADLEVPQTATMVGRVLTWAART